MPRNSVEWGNWNAICDICGFKFKANQLRKTWDNLMVCQQDYEIKHPQLSIRVRGDDPSVAWTRPEEEDFFVGPACFIWDQSAYAGLGSAGCMQAGRAVMPSPILYFLKFPPPPA
jgi:hypothetical protein